MATSQIKTDTDWKSAAATLNSNFAYLNVAIEKAKAQTMIKLPLCDTEDDLNTKYPPAYEDQMGLVGTSLPATLYKVENGKWVTTGTTVGQPSAVLAECVKYESLGTVDEVNF